MPYNACAAGFSNMMFLSKMPFQSPYGEGMPAF